jgi:hypothetical protein
MYARSSTFRGWHESVDGGIEFVRREVLPAILVMDDCVGLSMLANRETGRCITSSAWHSLATRSDSEAQVRELRRRIGDHLGARPEVDRWEIALLHRDHWSRDGARVRATWVQVEPRDVDRAVDFTRNTTLPTLERLPGFGSSSVMINRGSGQAVITVSFDTAAAEEGSREAARELREKFIHDTHGRIRDVEQFDLVLAHLHAPELV